MLCLTQQYMHKIKRRILRRMTSFGRIKVKKTSKSIQVYRIRESPFSKGLQGYTRVSLAIKKIPDNEVFIVRNGVKSAVAGRQGRNLQPIYDQIREHVKIGLPFRKSYFFRMLLLLLHHLLCRLKFVVTSLEDI